MGKLREWFEKCIADCSTNGELSASNNGQVLAEKLVDKFECDCRPDLNENDETSPAFVKNRPFYAENQMVTVSWDGDKTDKVSVTDAYYKVSALTPIAKEFVVCIKSGETETTETLSGSSVNTDFPGFCLISDYVVICYDNSKQLMGRIDFPETGIYFLYTGEKYTSKLEYTEETVNELNEKFIPDSIQRVGGDIIIPSSTTGSTKKFKITVDDSGTISATEVTE